MIFQTVGVSNLEEKNVFQKNSNLKPRYEGFNAT